MQTDLFGIGRRILVDDANGSIAYTPSVVDSTTAVAWYDSLQSSVDWRREKRWMYDREVDVPRLVAGFRLDDAGVPDAIELAHGVVVAASGVAYNSVGLNWYRDGRDSVAPHNDHVDEIAVGFPITLLSLGATRLMTIRSKAKPRRTFDIELEAGSVLVMSYQTQFAYDHGIPKTAARVGGRISLAFRVRPSRPNRAEKARARAIRDGAP